MGIMTRCLKSLFPKSWKLVGDVKAVVEALSLILEDVRTFFYGVIDESNPGTAKDCLEDWYNELGLDYDDTLSTAKLQLIANMEYSSTGGQSLGYLQDQIQKVYPDVTLEEFTINKSLMCGQGMAGVMEAWGYPSCLNDSLEDGEYPNSYYYVTGEIDTTADLYTLKNILERIMPAPLEPVYAVTILNLTETAEAGIGMAGLMMAGMEDDE